MSTAASLALGLLWVIVAFQTLVLLGLTRTVHRLQANPPSREGGLVGTLVPEFTAHALSGVEIDSASFRDRLTALLFVSPDCPTCGVSLAELDALQAKTESNVVVFCRSSPEKCAQLPDTYHLSAPVVVDKDFEYSRLFHVMGAPTAVLINAEGEIQSYGEPSGKGDLEEVIAEGTTGSS